MYKLDTSNLFKIFQDICFSDIWGQYFFIFFLFMAAFWNVLTWIDSIHSGNNPLKFYVVWNCLWVKIRKNLWWKWIIIRRRRRKYERTAIPANLVFRLKYLWGGVRKRTTNFSAVPAVYTGMAHLGLFTCWNTGPLSSMSSTIMSTCVFSGCERKLL